MQHQNTTQTLNRQHFTTSREMEYFTEKELNAQTGHPREDWGVVVVKEGIDNALDGCEDAGTAPVIQVTIRSDRIVITDNGPGIPEEVIGRMLDYSVRVSSREAYVAPDRGAQGNALKTLIAMPFVLDGSQGRVDFETQGVRHIIEASVDRIRQLPIIDHRKESSIVKTGTILTVYWPDLASSILVDVPGQFLQIAQSFAFLNPHLTLTLDCFGEVTQWDATNPDWNKWLPCNPTSPHWYREGDLARLISAYIAQDVDNGRTRLVREFISEFRGLTGSANQKRVLDDTGLHRASLDALTDGTALDDQRVVGVLKAMQDHARPVAPRALGIIGKAHMEQRCQELGSEMESFSYGKQIGTTDGLPWVIETAFAWRGDESNARRILVTGVNWSAGLINPFRQLGKMGESLDTVLANQRVGRNDPVIFLLHAACPRVAYSDRGKSAVVLGG